MEVTWEILCQDESCQVIESQNGLGWKGPKRSSGSNPPCHGQGHLPPAQGAQSSIQPGLEHCQGKQLLREVFFPVVAVAQDL